MSVIPQPPPGAAPEAGSSPPGRRLARAGRRIPGALRSDGGRRARWGVVDQTVSSLTNFAVAALAARVGSPRAFGAFSVALAVYIFLVWVARSVVAEPFVVRLTTADPARQAESGRDAVGASLAIGAVAGGVLLVAAVAMRSTSGAVLAVMGLSMPALLAQDTYRYLLMAAGHTRAAAANDTVWFLVQSLIAAVLLATGKADVVTITGAFGAGALVAALVGARQTGVAPAARSLGRWLRAHRDLGIPYLLELITSTGITQVAMIAIAAVAGVVAIGQLRAAILLVSPPTVLFSGAFLVAIPEAVRLRERSLTSLRRLVIGLVAGTSFITLLWTVGAALIPSHVGAALLKSNWSNGRHVLLPVAALTAGSGAVLSAVVGLRGLATARESLRVRMWAAPAILACGVIGAAAGDAYGAGLGLAVGTWFGAGLAWFAFRRALAVEAATRTAPAT